MLLLRDILLFEFFQQVFSAFISNRYLSNKFLHHYGIDFSLIKTIYFIKSGPKILKEKILTISIKSI
jgi:hypothetical protein